MADKVLKSSVPACKAASKKATPSRQLPALHNFSPSRANWRQVSLSPALALASLPLGKFELATAPSMSECNSWLASIWPLQRYREKEAVSQRPQKNGEEDRRRRRRKRRVRARVERSRVVSLQSSSLVVLVELQPPSISCLLQKRIRKRWSSGNNRRLLIPRNSFSTELYIAQVEAPFWLLARRTS